MTQPTSAEAFRWITESPILQRLHRQICSVLAAQLLPMTSGEVAAAMMPAGRINAITPRLTELRRVGAIREHGRRACRVTGRMCITWELSGREPAMPEYGEQTQERCAHCNGTGKTRVSLAGPAMGGTSPSP